jgi:hypothetical protein
MFGTRSSTSNYVLPVVFSTAPGQPMNCFLTLFIYKHYVTCRRDQLLEDSFSQLNAMGPDRLKGRLRIAYVNEAGLAEAGIDGGGLFKDFMEELLRQGFSPQVNAVTCMLC